MCGIIGYIGRKRKASDILLYGLKRLEYRGYDSVGISVISDTINTYKKKGKVEDLRREISKLSIIGNVGIGHTRWATHGVPNDINAHPQLSQNGKIAVVHNGIIENFRVIQQELQKQNYKFCSDTDTEVIPNLIESLLNDKPHLKFEDVVRLALNQLKGTYGLLIIHVDYPEQIIAVRNGSPLLIGVGKDEIFVTSDASAVAEYTQDVVYLEDHELAIINQDGYHVFDNTNTLLNKEIHALSLKIETLEKAGYPFFMLKEIYEQPRCIADCLRGRVDVARQNIKLGGLYDHLDHIFKAPRIILVACGTSWHAALYAEYLFENLIRIPVEVEYASEFRYRNPVINSDEVFFFISQSGETIDTLEALRKVKQHNILTLGICNVVGSTLAREVDDGVYTHCGIEIGVASTKAFIGQLTVLASIGLMIAQHKKTVTPEYAHTFMKELWAMPQKIESILKNSINEIKEIAKIFSYVPNFLYLGRSYDFPVALEGALKLKEISYIHAEAYPAAEMKHGPIALIDSLMPTLVIATTQHINDKIMSNMEEVKARGGRIIAICMEGNDDYISKLAEVSITIPKTLDELSPMLSVIPLQLLAYYIAVNRGCNVDQPRNLAKSVTVE